MEITMSKPAIKLTYIRWWNTRDGYFSVISDNPEKLIWLDSQIISVNNDDWVIEEKDNA